MRCLVNQCYTHLHDTNADVGDATMLGENEKIVASDSLDVKNHHSNKAHWKLYEECAISPLSHRGPRKEVDLDLVAQKQRDHTVNHGESKTIFRGLMLTTFMPSEPSQRAPSAYADAVARAAFENCWCHHW